MFVDQPHPKSILFVCDFPFAGAGGVGRVTEVLTAEFLRREYDVAYLALCAGRECIANGVTQYFIPAPSQISCKENIQYVLHLLDELGTDVIVNQAGAKIEVLDFLEKAKIDRPILSVHHGCVKCLQDNYQNILTENFKTRKFFKFINHPIGWMFLKIYHRLKQGYLFRKAIRNSDRLVLLSDIFVSEMKIYVPDSVVENVVGILNPAPFSVVEGVENKKENRLLFVGRLNYQEKRADLLLDLWKRIYTEYPDWHFDIVGNGPARDELEEKVKFEGLDRIYFHGFQDPRPYLERAKFFCMTSAFEGFGMVLVEAQAYGVVPFAFDCSSALPDIIQSGDNGFVFPKFNLAQYIDTLKSLMASEELRKHLAKNCQTSISKFDPTRICDSWVSLFSEVIRKRKEKTG